MTSLIRYLREDGPKPGWIDAVRQSFNAKGRASRIEYWNFQLFYWTIPIFLTWIGEMWQWSGFNAIAVIWMWILTPTHISVFIRRAHDSGRQGFWWFVPLGNIFITVVRGDSQANEYGEPHPYLVKYPN